MGRAVRSARTAASALLVLVLCFSGTARASSRPQIMVSAASSLTRSFQQIKAEFLKEHPDCEVLLNFGGSGALALQIERGAPCDVFASASLVQINALEKQGLVDTADVRIFARNQLVLIVPDPGRRRGANGIGAEGGTADPAPAADDSLAALRPTPIGFLIDLVRPEVRHIAIGNEATVPAGAYAAQVLHRFRMFDRVKEKLVPAEDVRQVLQYVVSGSAQAGFVFASDVTPDQPVAVITRMPDTSHDPILYPIAVLKGSEHRKRALELMHFVAGEKGRAILLQNGFLAPPPSEPE